MSSGLGQKAEPEPAEQLIEQIQAHGIIDAILTAIIEREFIQMDIVYRYI